ncbi:MAG TPA: hypothetical protein VFM54_21375 [Micromonosporaceae bacterium]|nr:hypothetical protein [Micromonosporaceae bacterium]
MSTQLRITLPGPEGSGDARRALVVMERLVTLLGQLEDVALDVRAARAEERSKWGFGKLDLGSVSATLIPTLPQRGATSDLLREIATWAIDGFAIAEKHEGLPRQWDRSAANTAAELANLLGLTPDFGMKVELLSDWEPVRKVCVTHRSAENLRAGLKLRRRSIGSVIGRLETATVHERREASLWPVGGGDRVTVYFSESQIDLIRQAWGSRVEASGVLTRDASDRLVSVRLQGLETLPDEGPPLTSLVGMDPNFTDGLGVDGYLREIRGAS